MAEHFVIVQPDAIVLVRATCPYCQGFVTRRYATRHLNVDLYSDVNGDPHDCPALPNVEPAA